MKNLNFRSLLIPIVIVVVSVLLFTAGFVSRGLYDSKQERDAGKVASQFIDSLLAGDPEKAYSLTSPKYQEVMNKELFLQASGNLKTEKPDKKQATITTSGDAVIYYQQVEGLKESPVGRTDANFLITVSKVDGKLQISDATLQ